MIGLGEAVKLGPLQIGSELLPVTEGYALSLHSIMEDTVREWSPATWKEECLPPNGNVLCPDLGLQERE